MTLRAEAISNAEIGYFRVFIRVPTYDWFEVTMFRNASCQVATLESADPFGDASCSIAFPQITVFDEPGQGDLWWLVPYADVNVVWENVEGHDYEWNWEGFIVSESLEFSDSSSTLTVECKGALFQADNYLGQPWFPSRPVPYELLIKDALDPGAHPGMRTRPLDIIWPEDWDRKVPEWDRENYLKFLKPWGVTTGQKWTGLTTRATGGWDPLLTGFVQGLLTVMYDNGGSQWTVMKRRGRQPVLKLRRPAGYNDPGLIRVQMGDPGVEASMSRDFTQSANVIYGHGQDIAGTAFSGMQITSDGQKTTYRPYAHSPYVHPKTQNPRMNSSIVRKESVMQFPNGMDEQAAQEVAQAQLQRFADPGFTGTITLRTDPMDASGNIIPRFLVQAGQSILIEGIRGNTEGVLAHVVKVDVNVEEATTQLTFDSKYRDFLTVAEVRARTLDSLTPLRSLQVGKYSNTVQDLLLPWSYRQGSGCIPSTGVGGKDATHFFTNVLPDNAQFPWTDWTTRHPPSDPKSAKYYVRIGPADIHDSRNNWAGWTPLEGKTRKAKIADIGYLPRRAYPIRMAQAGTIRLVQIGAYDKNGNLMKVRFHVSFFYGRGTGPTQSDMPRIPKHAVGDPPVRILGPPNNTYRDKVDNGKPQPNPFFENAWETWLPDGLQPGSDGQLYTSAQGASVVVGWGNFFEPAGYSPGRQSLNAPKTGMLVDETTWSFDTKDITKINKYEQESPKQNPDAGRIFAMIYCDDQGDEPVFFMGRCFRQEPGT